MVLEASAASSLDSTFEWDLNNDGIFGDRVGRRVGLTASDLEEWSISQSGEHTVGVQMNDRSEVYEDATTLTIAAAPMIGDFDRDGQVAFSDFLILSANYTKQNATTEDGDLDNDGTVGFSDFLIFSANFGMRS